jgi:hypothetical protein
MIPVQRLDRRRSNVGTDVNKGTFGKGPTLGTLSNHLYSALQKLVVPSAIHVQGSPDDPVIGRERVMQAINIY